MREFIDAVEQNVNPSVNHAVEMQGREVDSPPEYDPADQPHYDALDKTGFFGAQGAGAVAVSRKTGRVLLALRSDEVEQPGTWGNCGGAHHAEEIPHDAAEREFREESGYSGPLTIIPAAVFRSGDFVYRNFLAAIDDEFEARVNWEADEFGWFDLDNLPSPLHFGMEYLFSDAESVEKIRAIHVG